MKTRALIALVLHTYAARFVAFNFVISLTEAPGENPRAPQFLANPGSSAAGRASASILPDEPLRPKHELHGQLAAHRWLGGQAHQSPLPRKDCWVLPLTFTLQRLRRVRASGRDMLFSGLGGDQLFVHYSSELTLVAQAAERQAILRLFQEPRLADLGLIDRDRFLSA